MGHANRAAWPCDDTGARPPIQPQELAGEALGHRPLCRLCTVRPISVCGALAPSELHELERIMTQIQVEPGATVFHQDDPADAVYTLVGGSVRLYRLLADGRRQVMGFLFAGDFLGLSMEARYSFGADTITPTALCRFQRRPFEDLAVAKPELMRRLHLYASNELHAAQDQMVLLGRKTASEKLATFLVQMSRRSVRLGRHAEALHLPMSRTDIADYLGLTIETVSRTFTAFKDDGLIRVERADVALRDLDGLLALSQV
jgi:CRP/FNR family transcriptional regulator